MLPGRLPRQVGTQARSRGCWPEIRTPAGRDSNMIEARGLSKRYGDTLAVDNLSFSIAPGKITGFLGPNGAGKTTTMRLILGLDRPTAGRVTIDGKTFNHADQPMRRVG